jgi:hypothetical protein
MTQWEKKSEEQKLQQMEYNKIYRYKKKAQELGITLEEYQEKVSSRGTKKGSKPKSIRKVVSEIAESQVVLLDNSAKPDEIDVVSPLEPWVTFKMKKHIYQTSAGPTVGYKVKEKIVDATRVPQEV